jgi:N-acetylglucosamine transport system permease protein
VSSVPKIRSNDGAKAFAARWLCRIFLLTAAFLCLYPLFWNLISSFKTNFEFMIDPFAWPSGFEWDNYVRAFVKASIGSYFVNSLFVVGLSCIVLAVFAIPQAYVLARYKFFGSRFIMSFLMACIFIQAAYIMVPLFLQMNRFNLLNNLTGISVLYAVLRFPFSIFLLTGFMRTIPRSYEEAARIDGCTNVGILRHIIIPMSKPGIVTVIMLSAMFFWNEYPLALVMLQTEAKRTLPIGLARLFVVQQYATDWGALFAALIIVLVPTTILFLIGQKYLIGGMNLGGIKE